MSSLSIRAASFVKKCAQTGIRLNRRLYRHTRVVSTSAIAMNESEEIAFPEDCWVRFGIENPRTVDEEEFEVKEVKEVKVEQVQAVFGRHSHKISLSVAVEDFAHFKGDIYSPIPPKIVRKRRSAISIARHFPSEVKIVEAEHKTAQVPVEVPTVVVKSVTAPVIVELLPVEDVKSVCNLKSALKLNNDRWWSAEEHARKTKRAVEDKKKSARVAEQACWWATPARDASRVVGFASVKDLTSRVDDVRPAPAALPPVAPAHFKFVASTESEADPKGKGRGQAEEVLPVAYPSEETLEKVIDEIESLTPLLGWSAEALDALKILKEEDVRGHLYVCRVHMCIVSATTGPSRYTPRENFEEEARILPVWSPSNFLPVDFRCSAECCATRPAAVSQSVDNSTAITIEDEEDEDFELQLALAISLSLAEESIGVVESPSTSPIPSSGSRFVEDDATTLTNEDSQSTVEVRGPLSITSLKKLNKLVKDLTSNIKVVAKKSSKSLKSLRAPSPSSASSFTQTPSPTIRWVDPIIKEKDEFANYTMTIPAAT